jgi:hypothetical protein
MHIPYRHFSRFALFVYFVKTLHCYVYALSIVLHEISHVTME